ncbi:unnamed protein product, partial [Didymodactylos carnosus]
QQFAMLIKACQDWNYMLDQRAIIETARTYVEILGLTSKFGIEGVSRHVCHIFQNFYLGVRLYDSDCPITTMTGTRYNMTESGWIDERVFFDWLDRLFIPHMAQCTKPILLIIDGHYSHLSSRIAKLAKANQIHLLCLPPHATTALHPLDVAVFLYYLKSRNWLIEYRAVSEFICAKYFLQYPMKYCRK